MNTLKLFDTKPKRIWAILSFAIKRFIRIDGDQWAGAFAFNAFFSLFPLMILLAAFASRFIDQDRAGKEVITYVESYTPISGDMQEHISGVIAGVIKARVQASVVAFIILIWVVLQCFMTLIRATNRAWDMAAERNVWRLPLKGLVMLGVTTGIVFLGLVVPILIQITDNWLFPVAAFHYGINRSILFLFPLVLMFLGLTLFYRLAPRRPTRFAEVWAAALFATVLLRTGESLFVIYLKSFATFNAMYGTFGGIMALLLWIYISGCIFIFGACVCAVQASPPARSE
ncbi:MAG: hypothetical protein A2268_11670 [Candidatus Raymondbacteria bacterium RifOxyA12_full_50_37]|uniref:Uncharacterized protein n=1 Tax=Candidatus Raymondbacteria bacterium RIFOXYD12_FULL_49_13 TaxID=1817890 RepID=A0A1F7F3D2_UNCRA|nr:MAG: hypothetical protein A2268_11670 [Candidatus Raymondbacteria bacterium RifOxyA12_full_50_37]OGJ85996.1 MAG: hypothetical protein A2248_00505 [Candidatus Raymondbacteria bacterium RIFOXYA2_FULL_49_16]OGJ93784.1 MAG: hypothetical protein A2350_09720 [Candidatus Raymondbacteria bacterium RifOxyB12_full_50_8]OGJ97122.1 MAG: hypothetical protein A2453_12415 [Candidatus Raymondbacteria bacterium RIFOXYC2_FULL_50_21]OGK01175.1 MAG: hypothetical protein A2519_01480 [Candidatus Raymondbacteria b